MKSKTARTKICIYLLLVIFTAVFAWVSLLSYDEDLEVRVRPQIERAIVQVSKVLPQLEENEEALREVSSKIERSRQRILNANEGLLEDAADSGKEDVETVIDETLSWVNRVTKLRVGRGGYVIVISQEDYSILAHPDEKYIGEKLYCMGEDFEPADIPDLEEMDGTITRKDLPEDFLLFFPRSLFQKDPESKKFLSTAGAGIYGSVFAYRDTYIICGVTLKEAMEYIVIRCFFTTLIFFTVTWILVRYIGFALGWRREDPTEFRQKLTSYAVIALAVVFSATWYYQMMMDVTGDIAIMNDHADVAVETLNTYQKYRDKLSKWLDEQYLEQCRLAAAVVKEKGKENLTREDMAELAKDLDVKYIYVFDKQGKTIVTNSPYDHFKLSKNEEDQSYAFRPLLEGREYVIQEVQKDDSAGEKLQYIGVSLRDEDDLSDGFVQIAVDTGLRERLLNPINVQTVLDNLVIGLPEYALAVDKESLNIVATTGLGRKKVNIADLGFDVEMVRDNYDGTADLNGKTYYVGVSESEELYLIPLARSTDNTNALVISFRLALFAAAVYFLLAITALKGYRGAVLAAESETSEAGVTAGGSDAGNKGLDFLTNLIKVEKKRGFESRWKKQSAIPLEEQTPEMRTGQIIYRVLLIFSTALILFEAFLDHTGRMNGGSLYGIAYVMRGKWEGGLNLFSFTYCLFLLCVLYVFQELLNQILYRIAKISDLKRETILLLLRNALKYACALIFLYIGLAKFGIDTRALWASAGVLSLMVGFGAKDLIGDIISGLFIIFEGTYRIGDCVMVGSWYGTVEEIGIRYTKVKYYSETKIFNNSSIRDIIRNDGDTAREILKIPIPYEMDLLELEKLFERELPVIEKKIPGLVRPLIYQGVGSFDDSSVMLRIAVYCKPWERGKAVRALRREIKLLFDRKNISMPYNHVVVSEYKDEINTYMDVPDVGEETAEDAAETEGVTEASTASAAEKPV